VAEGDPKTAGLAREQHQPALLAVEALQPGEAHRWITAGGIILKLARHEIWYRALVASQLDREPR
jgi:hypothetical protein